MEAKELLNEKIQKLDLNKLQHEFLMDRANFLQRYILNTGEVNKLTNIEDLLYNLYSDWYYNVCLSVNENITKRVACFPKDINPCVTEDNIIEFLSNLPDVGLKFPISISGENDNMRVHINTRIVQADYTRGATQCFIALNMPLPFVDSFLRELIYRTGKEKIFPSLEFGLSNARIDNVVIYSTYEDLLKIIEIIYQIKDFLPGLFTDVVAKNELLNTLEGFMGYGEVDSPNIGMYYSKLLKSFALNIKDCACTLLKNIILSSEPVPCFSSSICNSPLTIQLYAFLTLDIIDELDKNISLLLQLKNRSQVENEYLDNLNKLKDAVKSHKLDDQIQAVCTQIRKNYATFDFQDVPIKLSMDDFDITLHISTDYINTLFDLVQPNKAKLHYTRIEKTRAVNSAMYPKFAGRVIARYQGNAMTDYEVIAHIIKKSLIENLNKLIEDTQDEVDSASIKSILSKIQDDSDEGREILHDYALNYVRAILDHDHAILKVKLLNKFVVPINVDINNTMIALFDTLKHEVDSLLASSSARQAEPSLSF